MREVSKVTLFSSCFTFLDLNFNTEGSRCYKNIIEVQHGIKVMSHWCRLYWFSHPAWQTVASAKPIYLFFPHNYTISIPE